jgi:hypothetical protein
VPADDVRHYAGVDRQFDCLGKVARGDFNLMAAGGEFRNQSMKEGHMRRVGEIDPDSHGL